MKLGDLYEPIDRSWWDAMSDESKIAYLTYLRGETFTVWGAE